MATCNKCGKSGFGVLEIRAGKCPSCRKTEALAEASKTDEEKAEERNRRETAKTRAKTVMVTTEAFIGEDIDRLDIVAGEAVFGMGLFKDIAANFRDLFGGRSKVVQETLKQAREVALDEMKVAAAEKGADAVIAIAIDYHSISTGTAVNMMIVACTGTAVRRKRRRPSVEIQCG